MQHVSKGPAENRSMSPLSIVEFSSREVRERVFKEIEKRGDSMQEDDSNKVSVKRAKIFWQLKRNAALKKAAELLKKNVRAKGKDVAIQWQIECTKDRAVKAANEVVFLQTKADAAVSF